MIRIITIKSFRIEAMRQQTICLLLVFLLSTCQSIPGKTEQVVIHRITLMPEQPQPYKMTDWYEKAQHFD